VQYDVDPMQDWQGKEHRAHVDWIVAKVIVGQLERQLDW